MNVDLDAGRAPSRPASEGRGNAFTKSRTRPCPLSDGLRSEPEQVAAMCGATRAAGRCVRPGRSGLSSGLRHAITTLQRQFLARALDRTCSRCQYPRNV